MATRWPRSQLLGQTMTSRKPYLFGLLFLLFLPSLSHGQVGYTTDEQVTGDASGTLYSAVVPLAFPRSYIFARGDFGDRPGVLDNYFATGGFMPMQFHGPDEVFYLEGQVWLTEQNEKSLVGGNFGVGNRWLIRDFSQMVGINAFLAWDQKGSGNNYDGAGVGVEWLSDYLGVTANAYIPWNRRVNKFGNATPIKEMTHFTGSNLAYVTLQPVEEQLLGADFEIGSAIPRAEWLSLFGGAYYFDAKQGNDFSGISGRAQLDFTSAIVNLAVTDDDRFGTSVNLTGELRLGDGPLDFTPRYRTLDNQMFDRARRQARIQTLQYIAQGEEIAINPANGLPFEFIHVDNTAAPGGDGTFESRFNQLDDASNMPTADIILAYSGNTEHGGPHLNANGGLVLEDNQIVLGEGYNFLLETANFPGLPCPLPDFAIGATDNPYIAGNAGADLITLANNNQILGLNMLAPTGGNAIVGTDITNTVIDEINRDVIFGVENTGAGGGILLTNIGGTADITNIGFDITDPAAAGGIVINNTDTADLTLTINNDLMKFPGLVVMGGQTGIGIAADNSNIAADIDNINNSDSETGIAIVGRNAANITAVVDNSNFTDSTGDGLNVDLDMSTATAMFTNGSFDNSGDAAGDNAIDLTLTDNSVFNLGLTNITGDNAFDDGIFGSIDDGSQLTIVANDTSFSGAQNGDGLDIDATMGSIFSGSFINGSFADAGGNGISLDFDGMGTTGVLTLDNVPLDNAGLNALEVIADNNAVVTVTGDGVSGSGAGEDGIHLDADNTATIGVVLTNTGSFAGAGNDGVDLTNDNGGRIILNATGEMGMPIDFSGATTGNGLISTANGLGTRTDIDLVSGANFDNAAIDAINISSNAGAFTTLDGTMISGASAGDDGIQLSSNAGRIDVNITQAGSFANAGQAGGGTGDGIDIFNEAGGRITLNLAGDGGSIIDFSGAEQNGLVSNTDGDGTVTGINLSTGAMFDNAGEDAIKLTSTDLGITQLVGSMVSGSNAGDDGIDLNNDGGMINLQLTNTGSFANAGQNLLGGGDGIDSVNDNGGVTAINISGAGGMPVDFSGAELDGLYSSTGLNASTDIDFNTGAMFDNAGNHAIHLEANDAAGVSLTGDNVSGSMAGSHGILINAENSAGVVSTGVDVNLTNTGSFAGAGGDGLQFNGTDGADININIAGTAMTPADFSGAAVRGVNGNLDASMGILTLTNTNFNGPLGSDGMFIDANNDSVFVGTITDSTFNDATMGDGIEVNMDGSAGMLTLTNVDANNAGDNGLMLRADDTLALGSSTLDVNLNNVNLNSATSDAINVIAMDGGYIDIDGTDVDGMDAGDMGVQLSANASRIDFTLNSTGTNNFTNSGDTGLVFNGMNMATINVNVSDTNFDDTVPGGFGINGSLTDSVATLNLTDVTANNAEFAGLRVRADNSTVSGTLSNVELDDAGTDAIFIQGLLGADVDFTMSDISGLRAGDDGFDIVTTDAMTDVNIQIDDSDFSNSTNNGLEFDFRSSSNITFNSDTGLTVNMAGADSLNLFGDTLATADIDITNGSLMPAFDDMTDATIMGGAIGDVLIDPTSAAGAGDNGLEFNVTTGGQLNFTLGSPMGPDPDSPLSTTMDPVGSNGVIGTIDAGTVNLTFNNSDINSDGSSTGDGINVTGTNASTFNLNLNNSDVNGWGNGNGIIVAMTDSTAGINFNGSTVNDAGLNAIDLTSNGTSTIDIGFDANGTTIQNTGGTAINALANGGTINFDSPGFLTVDTTGGQGIALNAQNAGTIDFQAMNGLTIDGAGQAGLLIDAETGSMVTVDAMGTMANPLLIQNSGGQGVAVNADGDSMVDVTLRNGSIQGNGTDPMFLPGHGIQAVANGDMVMGDGSLINFTLMDVDITGNTGDGVNLVANMGDNTMMGMPITSGINYSHNGGTIGNNAHPDPAVADGIGFGISATANGGGMGADTIIGLSLNNVSVLSPPQPPGNEEGAINLVMNNGGVIIQDITGGELSGPVMVCADGNGSFASLSLDNVLIKPSVDGAMDPDAAAIVLKAINDGSVEANFSNMTGATAISGHGAQAVAFLADTGGQINATFTNIEMNNNLLGLGTLTGPLPAGHPDEPIFTGVGFGLESVVQGLVQGSGMAASSANVTFTDVNIFDNAGANAFEVDVLNGGQLNLTVDNMTTFNNGAQAGEGEFQVNVEDAGSVATINIDGLTANDSGGKGVNLISSGGGAFDIVQLNDITANNATEGGFVLQGDLVDNGDALNPTVVTLSNSSFNNAMGGEGVLIGLNTSGETELNVTNVMANNANAAVAFGGVDLVLNNNGVGGDQTINVTNVQSNDSTGVGLVSAIIGLDATSTGSINVTGSSFNNAAEEGILTGFMGAPGSSGTIDITNTNAMNAGADGFEVFNMGAAITDISLDTVNVSGAGDNGVDITVANQIVPINVTLDAVTADDTDSTGILIDLDNITGGDSAVSIANSTADNTMMGTGGGIDINLDGVTGGTQAISLDNVSAQNAAGADGLDITVANTVATDIVDIDITGSNFDGAAMTGVDINVAGPAISNIDMTDTTANMAGLGGVDINLANAQDMSSITLSNVDAVGSMGGNGLLVDATLAMGATIDVGINGGMGGVSNFSNSATNGAVIDVNGDNTNTINLSIDGLTVNNVFPNPNGPGGDGLQIAVNNGENVVINDLANITANGNSFDGIDLNFTNNTQVAFGAGNFAGITANNNQQHGMKINVGSGAVVDPVTLDGLTLTGNGASGVGFNGLDIRVHGMNSAADFTFTDMTINNTGGRGINADVYSNGMLTLNVEDSTVMNSGLEGIDINVGSINGVSPTDPPIAMIPGTFVGSLTGVDVSNSGQSLVFQANGIDLNVGGAGSTAEMTFDNTTSNSNDGNGINIVANTGADATIAVNNGTEASSNVLGGFILKADGATTDLDFTSASGMEGDNTFDNNLGGPGFEITLTNGVTVDDLVVNASASGNAGDGVRIIANDGTGVDINGMFDISGNNLTVNGNTGNGLFVDFNAVGNINDFTLENATVSQNTLNQVFVRMTDMTLGNFILRDLTATGTGAGASDGVRVELIDTMVTNVSTPGNLQGFVVDGVTVTNNGGRGLNLIASDSDFNEMPNGADSGIAGGIITGSQFSGNGQAGAALTFKGEGVYDFNIFDNTGGTLGFNNNTGRGLLIEAQDHTTFTMAGNNPSDADPTAGSFYNNSISGNGGIGMHVVASEPNFSYSTDGMGPRIELELGDILRNPNILTGNTDAAMAIELLHDATGSFSIVNSVHESTVDGANANFNGDGLAFRLANFASLDSLTIDGTMAGVSLNNNAGSGLVTIVSGGATEQARLGTLSNLLVVNTTFEGNGIHGIDIRRSGTGLYGATAANDMVLLGLNGQGNTFSGNAQAGINVMNVNAAAAPNPFRVEIIDNTFVDNQDGIVLVGQANAQFTGRLSDNDFNDQTRDGIRVTLQQQSALGDPSIVNNPLSLPFLMDGNQIIDSGRHGIFFDTNFSNPVQSNAFANVLIQESEFDGTRTRIEGSTQNGIRVIDNSGRSGGTIVPQNTYTVYATDILDSGLSGIRFNNASAGGTQSPNGAHALIVGDPLNVVAGRRDVVINNSGQDGIEVNVASTVGNSSTLTVNRTEITESGRDGINALVQGVGRLNTTLDLVDLMFNGRHGMEFNITSVSSPFLGPTAVTTMHGVRSNENMGRGLNILAHHDTTDQDNPTQSTSIWNIGTAARVADPTALNEFILNAHEGIVIDMQAQALDQSTVTTATSGIQTAQNTDVDIVTNFGNGANGSHNNDATNSTTLTARSTLHPNSNNSGVVTAHSNFPANSATRVRLTAVVNVINNNIFSNGGAQSFFTNDIGFQDGLSIGVGQSTRLNALIANNRFGGNFGDDINIFAQRSSELNPANSVRNAAGNPNGNNQSYLVLDPVAYADVVFGALDPTLATSAYGNSGDSVRIGTYGTNVNNASERITGATGVFTNNDTFKGTAQSRRGVFLAGRVQVAQPITGFDADGNAGAFTGYFDPTLNDFFENGAQQMIGNDFNGWLQPVPPIAWPGPVPNGP